MTRYARDLSKPIAPNEVRTIEDVWRERLVVLFRDQKLSDPQLIAFSRNFGERDPSGPNPYGEPFLKDHPELNVISNVVESGKPIVDSHIDRLGNTRSPATLAQAN